MAKKKEKDAGGPREAVRGAVESTFQRAAGGASRAQDLLDDIASTVKALREANLVETLEGLRDEVQSLARRVAALELRGSETAKPAPKRSTPARKPAAKRAPAASKPAARKSTGASKKATGARASSAAKPAAKRPSTAKPGSARSTAKKPASRKS